MVVKNGSQASQARPLVWARDISRIRARRVLFHPCRLGFWDADSRIRWRNRCKRMLLHHEIEFPGLDHLCHSHLSFDNDRPRMEATTELLLKALLIVILQHWMTFLNECSEGGEKRRFEEAEALLLQSQVSSGCKRQEFKGSKRWG